MEVVAKNGNSTSTGRTKHCMFQTRFFKPTDPGTPQNTYNVAPACEKSDCRIPFGICINASLEGATFSNPLDTFVGSWAVFCSDLLNSILIAR